MRPEDYQYRRLAFGLVVFSWVVMGWGAYCIWRLWS